MLHKKDDEQVERHETHVQTSQLYLDLKFAAKWIAVVVLVGIVLYALFVVFSYWILFSIPIIPLWAALLIRFLTRDYIRVLEVKLPGDSRTAPSGEFRTISYADDTALWYFPPEKFKQYEKKGKVIQLPRSEIYVADRVDDENQIIYFSESVLSNLDYYTSSEAFLYLKKQLTSLMRQNILLKNFMSSYAYKISARLLERFKIVDNVAEKADAPELLEPDEFENMINKMLRIRASERKQSNEVISNE